MSLMFHSASFVLPCFVHWREPSSSILRQKKKDLCVKENNASIFLGSENAEAVFSRSLSVHYGSAYERSAWKIRLSRKRVWHCALVFITLVFIYAVALIARQRSRLVVFQVKLLHCFFDPLEIKPEFFVLIVDSLNCVVLSVFLKSAQ